MVSSEQINLDTDVLGPGKPSICMTRVVGLVHDVRIIAYKRVMAESCMLISPSSSYTHVDDAPSIVRYDDQLSLLLL